MKAFVLLGVFYCLTAVLLGAFAAHGLKARLSEDLLNAFEVGVRYQFYHGLGLLLVFVLHKQLSLSLAPGAWLMAIGVILFSGSLYLLALLGWRWLGPVTPLGGLCFIGAWAWLFWALCKGV